MLEVNAAPAPVLVPLPLTVPVYVPSLLDLTAAAPDPPQPEIATSPQASRAKAASERIKQRRQRSMANIAPPRMPQPVRPACCGPDRAACAVTEVTVMVEVAVPPEVRVTDEAAQVAGLAGEPEVAVSVQVKVTMPA